MDPVIVLFGFGVGVLVGPTGMGGGSLMTPLLIVVFGVKPVTAVGTDLTYGAITKTLGVYVLHAIEDAYGHEFDEILLTAVAITLLFTGAAVLTRALLQGKVSDRERFDPTLRNKVIAVLLGIFVGFVLGVTSAGSGT